MQYVICTLILSFTISFSAAQQTVLKRPIASTFVKKNSIPLSKSKLKQVKSGEIPFVAQLRGNKLYPSKGYVFLKSGSSYWAVPKAFYSEVDDDGNGQVFINFKPGAVGKYPKPIVTIIFCSCGDNTINIPGDKCWPELRDNNVWECAGECQGQNEGKDCSNTFWQIGI